MLGPKPVNDALRKPLAHFWRKTLRQDGPGATLKKSLDVDHPPNRLPYLIRSLLSLCLSDCGIAGSQNIN